jgi:transitional endoplasmic reticulum ATPase
MEKKQHILQKNTVLENKYSVLLFIKKGKNAETYRVKGSDGKLYLLKLFKPCKVAPFVI